MKKEQQAGLFVEAVTREHIKNNLSPSSILMGPD
jgi:hypothetical protein